MFCDVMIVVNIKQVLILIGQMTQARCEVITYPRPSKVHLLKSKCESLSKSTVFHDDSVRVML